MRAALCRRRATSTLIDDLILINEEVVSQEGERLAQRELDVDCRESHLKKKVPCAITLGHDITASPSAKTI